MEQPNPTSHLRRRSRQVCVGKGQSSVAGGAMSSMVSLRVDNLTKVEAFYIRSGSGHLVDSGGGNIHGKLGEFEHQHAIYAVEGF